MARDNNHDHDDRCNALSIREIAKAVSRRIDTMLTPHRDIDLLGIAERLVLQLSIAPSAAYVTFLCVVMDAW